jgi:hypothetical protein
MKGGGNRPRETLTTVSGIEPEKGAKSYPLKGRDKLTDTGLIIY